MTRDDMTLVRDFAANRSEAAFSTLVDRHIGLVHTAAVRQVGDAHLAEEVTQAVFLILARKAAGLGPKTVLPAWLYRTTRYTAADALKTRRRRQAREQEAYMQSTLNPTDHDAVWRQLAPLLDDALAELGETDRAALVLRYFENQTVGEIAGALRLTESAAQKRLTRALEKLRAICVKRGVTLTATAIAGAVTANAVQAAPAGLALTVTAAAAKGAVVAASVTALVNGTIKTIAMTTIQKTMIAATLVAAVGTGMFEARQVSQLRAQNQTLQKQQAPLAEQIQQLQRERDAAAKRLASLADEIARTKGNSSELLKLRGEVTLLRNSARDVAQIKSDPVVQLARDWKAKEAKLRQLFEQRPDQRISEMRMLVDVQWLDIAKEADLESGQGIRLAMARVREIAALQFAQKIQRALIAYMRAHQEQLPNNPSQLSAYFKPPVEDVDAILARYEMLSEKEKTNAAYKGASIIQKVVDGSVDNAIIIGSSVMGYAPKPGQGYAPINVPREVVPVLKSYMDANNHQPPLGFDELRPYATTPAQKAALENFIKALTE